MSESSGGGGGSVGCGCGPIVWLVGAVLAGVLSFIKGNTILWVALHACVSWFYVIYLCFGCGGGFPMEALDRPASEVFEEVAEEEETVEVESKPETEPEPELYEVVNE